jgi:hypothetical protein
MPLLPERNQEQVKVALIRAFAVVNSTDSRDGTNAHTAGASLTELGKTRPVRLWPQLGGNEIATAIWETGLPDLYRATIFATSNFTRLYFLALPPVISLDCFSFSNLPA